MLPILEEKEREFFNLVGTGDVKDVAEFLRANPNFNINCVDFQVQIDITRYKFHLNPSTSYIIPGYYIHSVPSSHVKHDKG